MKLKNANDTGDESHQISYSFWKSGLRGRGLGPLWASGVFDSPALWDPALDPRSYQLDLSANR